jgi:anti-sigma B factor antagonist
MPLTIVERRVRDVTLLELQGRLVFYGGAAVLRVRMNDLMDEARLKFILDLAGVTYIDSFGVGVIASKYLSAHRKGGDVRLLHLSHRSHHVLHISGLTRILQVFDSEDQALRSFADEGGV